MVPKFVVCFAIITAVALNDVKALQEEDKTMILERVRPHVAECSKEFGISEDDLKEAKRQSNVDGIDACFFACVLKKTGHINEAGLFDNEKALERSKQLKDENDKQKAAEVIAECSSVNSENVSDGAKGCERAKLLVKCLAKHKQAFWN